MIGDKEYDFGATLPPGGNFVRSTTITYGSYNSGTCSAITGVIDHPCSTVTTNQSGTTVAQTNYTYNTANGNLTNVSKLAGSGYVNSSYSNNANGTVHIATDARGVQTTYTYGACNGMYVTNISHPLSISESMNWDCNGGAVISATDANSKTTTYSYTNPANGVGDPFWRLTRVNYPDGGQATTTYNDTASPQNLATNQLIDNSGHSISTQTNFDTLGRVAQTQLISDPDGATYTVTTYDALGRPYQAYNPTRCSPPTTNCGSQNTWGNTWGYTTTLYDALGRVTQFTRQDGQIATTSYSGNCATVTDEAGKARKSCFDGLGRLTQVFEDPAGLNYETDYTYDALDNLLTVNQKGASANSANWRTRAFNYDSLSRLLTATNPESGTSSYTYDANGNLASKTSPAPNQTGSATVTLSYCYDALNRLTAKAYTAQSCPMSSPVATYLYDQASYNGLTITNGIGRRTGMTDQAGSEAWSYDSMGRVASDQRITNGLTRTYTYAYNLDGSLYTVTHPDALVVTFQQGGAGRPISETSGDAGWFTACTMLQTGVFATGSKTGGSRLPWTGRLTTVSSPSVSTCKRITISHRLRLAPIRRKLPTSPWTLRTRTLMPMATTTATSPASR
jgi:YD repeat-containing protein